MISGVRAAVLPCCFRIASLVRVVERPERLLADVDAVERRLREVDLAVGDQLRQVAVDERQQQRRDVVAVGIGVGEDDDLAVAQPREVEVLAEAAAERGHQIGQLLVLEHLRQRRALGVQHLAAQRQDRLPRAVAALLGRAAGRIALDDEQLAAFARRVACSRSACRAGSDAADVALLRDDLGLRRAAGLARARRQDDARDDRFGDADVVIQPVLERRAARRRRPPTAPPGCSAGPWSGPGTAAPAMKTLSDAGQALADVFGGERHALRREVVRLDVVAHRLADAGAQAVLVRAARAGRDAVDVAAQVLVGRLGPLQRRDRAAGRSSLLER